MNPDIMPISGKDALFITQVGFMDDIERYTQKVNELCDELEERVKNQESVFPKDTPRLMVLGTPFAPPNWKLHTAVETTGGCVINEESCIGHRYFKDNVDIEGVKDEDELYARLMKRYSKIDCACFTPNQERQDNVRAMVKDLRADGVIHYSLMFCQPYEHEAIKIEKTLRHDGTPMLSIATDYSMEDVEQLKTRVEAFVEMIK